jgi:hypothetical protein
LRANRTVQVDWRWARSGLELPRPPVDAVHEIRAPCEGDRASVPGQPHATRASRTIVSSATWLVSQTKALANRKQMGCDMTARLASASETVVPQIATALVPEGAATWADCSNALTGYPIFYRAIRKHDLGPVIRAVGPTVRRLYPRGDQLLFNRLNDALAKRRRGAAARNSRLRLKLVRTTNRHVKVATVVTASGDSRRNGSANLPTGSTSKKRFDSGKSKDTPDSTPHRLCRNDRNSCSSTRKRWPALGPTAMAHLPSLHRAPAVALHLLRPRPTSRLPSVAATSAMVASAAPVCVTTSAVIMQQCRPGSPLVQTRDHSTRDFIT